MATLWELKYGVYMHLNYTNKNMKLRGFIYYLFYERVKSGSFLFQQFQ